MILGVIFDFDNTIYDYNTTNKLALKELFTTISTDYNIEYNIVNNAFTIINNKIKGSHNYSNKFNKSIYIKQLIEHLNIPIQKLDTYLHIYDDIFLKHIKVYPGFIDFIQYIKNKNINIGLLSNNIFLQQYKKLKILYILDYFDTIVTCDEVSHEKPDIHIYLDIIHKMNISPHNLVMIGDNIEHDILPSLSLSMLPFLFVNGDRDSDSNDRIILREQKYIEFNGYKSLLLYFTRYFKNIDELLFLSRYFGQCDLNIQGPGGNISIKSDDVIYIKSSGYIIGNTSYTEGYCLCDNNKVLTLLHDGAENKLKTTKIYGYKIPSMETFFHSFMKKYTVHIHFILANVFLCSETSDDLDFILSKFPYKYKIIEYITPGLLLAQNIYNNYTTDIDIYFLKNHGIIITHSNIDELLTIYENIFRYFDTLLENKYNHYYNTFLLNKYYYKNITHESQSIIIQYIDYPHNIIENIVYCFPDLALFIRSIIKIDNIDNIDTIDNLISDKDLNNCIIILHNIVYICAENISKISSLKEILYSYKILYTESLHDLKNIKDIDYLKNMESEKYRLK